MKLKQHLPPALFLIFCPTLKPNHKLQKSVTLQDWHGNLQDEKCKANPFFATEYFPHPHGTVFFFFINDEITKRHSLDFKGTLHLQSSQGCCLNLWDNTHTDAILICYLTVQRFMNNPTHLICIFSRHISSNWLLGAQSRRRADSAAFGSLYKLSTTWTDRCLQVISDSWCSHQSWKTAL